jgi:hypothetical protein
MSIAGRSTLISSSLNNTPIYHMSIYLLPKSIINDMDKVRRTFFWQGGHAKRKYHLVKWIKVCKCKKKGGLGIKSLKKMNLSLLCKWWWKLEIEDGLWQKIVKHKYLKKDTIFTVSHKQSDSSIWADLLKVKKIYLQGRKVKTNDGRNTMVWNDTWLYSKPLCDLYPDLYKLCDQKNMTVHQMISGEIATSFNRHLTPDLKRDWEKILTDIFALNYNHNQDCVSWKLEKKGIFTVKSTYNALTQSETGPSFKKIWKGKVPAKIKIFLWLVANNAILTKDNMKKRNWKGDPECYFCQSEESVTHLLFSCPIAKSVWVIVATCLGASNVPVSFDQCWAWCERWIPNAKQFHVVGVASICWAIWKTRNRICFEKKKLKNPLEI